MWDWFKISFVCHSFVLFLFLLIISIMSIYFQRFAYSPPLTVPSNLFSFFHRRYMPTPDEQLARSYSFELRPNINSHLPSMDNFSPTLRYSNIQRILREDLPIEKPLRSSTSTNGLVNTAMISSQVSLTNRKVTFHYFAKWNISSSSSFSHEEENHCDRSRL